MRSVECIVVRGFKLKIQSLRQNIIFFIELSKVLEVAKFRFLVNFRFLTVAGINLFRKILLIVFNVTFHTFILIDKRTVEMSNKQ